jgi:hypothetical protein
MPVKISVAAMERLDLISGIRMSRDQSLSELQKQRIYRAAEQKKADR